MSIWRSAASWKRRIVHFIVFNSGKQAQRYTTQTPLNNTGDKNQQIPILGFWSSTTHNGEKGIIEAGLTFYYESNGGFKYENRGNFWNAGI